jgi:hypothetical protein
MPKLVISPGHKFTIHGRQMVAGDEFECTDSEAVIWQGKGWAIQKRGPGRPRKDEMAGRYYRTDMRAEDE